MQLLLDTTRGFRAAPEWCKKVSVSRSYGGGMIQGEKAQHILKRRKRTDQNLAHQPLDEAFGLPALSKVRPRASGFVRANTNAPKRLAPWPRSWLKGASRKEWRAECEQ